MTKIACLGNMNNNLFALTRYLRDRGFDVSLLLYNNELPHFLPAADAYDTSFETYTRHLAWGDLWSLFSTPPSEIAADLREFDILIGCGMAPAFTERIGRRLDIFSIYGSDVYQAPFFHPQRLTSDPIFSLEQLRYNYKCYNFSRLQRRGIANCRYSIDKNGTWLPLMDKLGFSGKYIREAIPMLYIDQYIGNTFESYSYSSPVGRAMKRLRETHDLIILHQARHEGPNPKDRYAQKGNDKLIRGYANFIKESKARNPCLVMFEYGSAISHSKQLVQRLGIGSHVHWFRKMRRKDIMTCLSFSDIGSGEFEHSWLTGGVIIENLAAAIPFLQYRDDKKYAGAYNELYPVMNAQDDLDILKQLIKFEKNPEKFKADGIKGRKWLRDHILQPAIDSFSDTLEYLSQDH